MNYSRNKVFGDALKKQGVEIITCISDKKGILKYKDLYKKHAELKGGYDALIVGFPGFVIAPFARLISKKKIVLDALSSRYDSDIVSRNAHQGNWFKKIKILCIDWLAFICAHEILVESEVQKEFISKKFRISQSKIHTVYTGVDETVFKQEVDIQKNTTFTVLFRGRIMNEAGVPTILHAAKLLQDEAIRFDIIGYGWGSWIETSRKLYAQLDHTKVHWDEKALATEEIVRRTQQADISLGQFGNNERVNRTIPHKAFEAMRCGIPYITGKSEAVGEVLVDGESCVMIDPENPEQLARTILQLKEDSILRARLSDQAECSYNEHCSGEAIGKTLMALLRND
jgi:glycosyltransferase involved in cell wall biosynthesis